MTTIALYSKEGKKIEDVNVRDEVFAVPSNDALVAQVYDVLRANMRSGHAHAKDRSERAGSGKKPWKQKGTGRARTGSVRNPIWRKGGIVFGPTKERNFSKNVNVSMKRAALRVVLSEKVRRDELIVLDSWKLEEQKTKRVSAILSALNIDRKVLVALGQDEMETKRASANISHALTKGVEDINVVDVLHVGVCVLSKVSLEALEKRLMK